MLLFILNGAFVERSGAGQLFMDFVLALAGHTSGGPARVAVITSSLFDIVSGSAVANAIATGTFTIPLMKRTGFRPAFAGAVEAVASTGGQLMPPIMGAAAFVMAKFLGVSYLSVAAMALLLALLLALALALGLTMLAGIVPGMGLPTTPAYIVPVALLVPALVRLGVQVEAAHLFVLYFAVLSAITPPVAMAGYAANGLSRASLVETSWAAVKLGLTGYIIPFMFLFAPSLLLQGDVAIVALSCATATLGVTCLAGGLHEHFFFGPARWWERLMLIAAALVLIKPGWMSDLAGLVLVGRVAASQLWLWPVAKIRLENTA